MEKSDLWEFLGLVGIKDHMFMLLAAYFHSLVLQEIEVSLQNTGLSVHMKPFKSLYYFCVLLYIV